MGPLNPIRGTKNRFLTEARRFFLLEAFCRCKEPGLPQGFGRKAHGLGNFSSPHGECRRVYNTRKGRLGNQAIVPGVTQVNPNRNPGFTSRVSAFCVSNEPLSPGQQVAELAWPELEKITPDERAVFFETLAGQWCRYCGYEQSHIRCQCQNDD
jgi:hypothetical protein